MSKGKFKENVEWLSDPKIAITVAVLVLIGIGLVWFFWDKIKAAFVGTKDAVKDKNLYGSTTETIDFDTLAQQLYQACKGWGTDEAAIDRVLGQIRTDADYAALRRAYATNDSRYSLDARLQSEGTKNELIHWRSILDANGVTIYSF